MVDWQHNQGEHRVDSPDPFSTPRMTRRVRPGWKSALLPAWATSRAAGSLLGMLHATELSANAESPGTRLAMSLYTRPPAKPQIQCAALRGPMWSLRLPSSCIMSTLALEGGWEQWKKCPGQTKNISCSQGSNDGFGYNWGESKNQNAMPTNFLIIMVKKQWKSKGLISNHIRMARANLVEI